MEERLRRIAQEMIRRGVEAADPSRLVQNKVTRSGSRLEIGGSCFPLDGFDRVLLFGIGKAATPMCQAFERLVCPDQGLIITKIGAEDNRVEMQSIPVRLAHHPVPAAENVRHSQELVGLVQGIGARENVLIVLMISGGGSAMFTVPPEGVSVDEISVLNQLLLQCGANIHQMNTVRKHVSMVNGGRFGQLCADKGATTIALILSDVVGDDLSVIASGPTYPDQSTFAQAIAVLQSFDVFERTPRSIRKHLEAGLARPQWEPMRQAAPRVHNILVGNNMSALTAARDVALKEGFSPMILTSQNCGEAKVVAKCIMAIAKEVQDSGHPVAPPAALVIGGEMVTTFNWEDRNGFGPNREFVLSAAIEIAGREGLVVAAADTDGVDGHVKAGAIADGNTLARTCLSAQEYLEKHNAEAFFDSLDDSLVFSSRTNVNDINVVLIDKPGLQG